MTSPVAEEAARLLAALQSWASTTGASGATLPLAGESPECRVCPVCQLLRAVRGVRPDVVEHLAGASTELVAALQAALDGGVPATAPRRVERIDIGD